MDSAAAQSEIQKLVFSPWTKFCPTDEQACQTLRLGHTEAGKPIVATILTEPRGGAKKSLRVIVPIGMQIPQGTRLIIDQGEPMSAPYIACFSKGCMADYDVTANVIGRLKSGQTLVVQAVDRWGQPISLSLPLADFVKAYGGPPSKDAKLFQELKEQLPQRDRQDPGELPRHIRDGEQLVYSPWTKLCVKGAAQPASTCFTRTDGRIGLGPVTVAAALIESTSGTKRILRVTLPFGMQLPQGTRMIIDDSQPLTAPYVVCFNDGCLADYEASDELIGRLKLGKGLTVQGIDSQGKPVSLILPLADFVKAHDGLPMDPREFEERQRQLQEQLKNGR